MRWEDNFEIISLRLG